MVTTAALAALAGVALNSNSGMPPAAPAAVTATTAKGAPIVTRTSGAPATGQPTSQLIAAQPVKRKPHPAILTRTSGAGRRAAGESDD